MSQAGLLKVTANILPPVVPTSFVTNSGTAIPIANVLQVLGTSVAAASTPVRTTGATNVVTVQVQTSQAIAATDATKIGLAAFNNTEFTVDANGFVSLIGGTLAIDSIGVDAATAPGTNPVVPTVAGLVTVTGAQVAAGVVGANVIRTNSLSANTYSIQIQRTAAVASTASVNNGVAHFDSAAFDVDANGFVQLNGGGIAATAFTVQANTAPGTNPVVPTASGVVTINGAAVANHSVVLESRSRAANAYNLEVQYAAAAAATDATKSGVAHFDSAKFTVDANGFVSASGTGLGQTITGNSGGALSPTAGNWNILGATVAAGTAPLVTAGSGSTLTINAQRSQALASADSTKVGLSNFNSTDFTVDANGFVSLTGTNLTVTGQKFTSTGAFTYTPTTGMKYVIVELAGGGGGGGGAAATTNQIALAQAGSGAGYARFILTAAQVGASLSGSVGAGGTAASSGNAAGGNGGNTTLATTAAWTVGGGTGGAGSAAGTQASQNPLAGGTVTTGTGTILMTASGGQSGNGAGTAATIAVGCPGGGNILGVGGLAIIEAIAPNGSNGAPGFGFGSGAGGAVNFGTNAAQTGTAGQPGVAIFTEFIFV